MDLSKSHSYNKVKKSNVEKLAYKFIGNNQKNYLVVDSSEIKRDKRNYKRFATPAEPPKTGKKVAVTSIEGIDSPMKVEDLILHLDHLQY